MPRLTSLKSTDPVWLRQKAQQRLVKAHRFQKQQQDQSSVASELQENDTEGAKGNDAGNKKTAEAKGTFNHLTRIRADSKESKPQSKFSKTLKPESTYCLTGPTLFWQTNEQGIDTGSWRRGPGVQLLTR